MPGDATLTTLKQSRSSLLMKIYGLRKKWLDIKRINELINDAEVHLGVPGCGKTYEISKNLTGKDIVISMVREPIEQVKKTLLSMGKKNLTSNVLTLEQACNLLPEFNDTLIVDES